MTTLTYPSEQFPGPPSVSVDIPEGWSPIRIIGTLLAARQTSSAGQFAPNIVVRGFTRSGDFTIGRALTELKSYVDGRTDGNMDAPFAVEIAGVPFVGINVSWTDEKVGDVVQAHLFAGARRGPLVDLVQVTGSVGGDQVDSDYDAVQQLMWTRSSAVTTSASTSTLAPRWASAVGSRSISASIHRGDRAGGGGLISIGGCRALVPAAANWLGGTWHTRRPGGTPRPTWRA